MCDRVSATIRLVYQTAETPTGPTVILIKDSPGGSNGSGWEITVERAERIKAAFKPPHSFKRIRQADFADDAGYCEECAKFYCVNHWDASGTGGGWYPQQHLKILDPYCAFDNYP